MYLLQLDEHNHSQLGDITSLLQDCVDVDDEMKSKLNDTYHQVTELSGNRETQLRQSLCVRGQIFILLYEIVEQFTSLRYFINFF